MHLVATPDAALGDEHIPCRTLQVENTSQGAGVVEGGRQLRVAKTPPDRVTDQGTEGSKTLVQNTTPPFNIPTRSNLKVGVGKCKWDTGGEMFTLAVF